MFFCPPRRDFLGFRLTALVAITVLTVAATLLFIRIQPAAAPADFRYTTPGWAIALHIGTVLPALVLGGFVLARPKGGRTHRALGRTWMALMLATAVASFWIRGPSGSLSGIHLFSIGTLIAVPVSLWRIRAGDVAAHRRIMVSLYIGLIVAGAFALAPDRRAGHFISQLLFG